MREFVINANDSGQRLDKFITKTLKGLPVSLMYKFIRTKRIKVNGKRAEQKQMLVTGDTVQMYIPDEFFGDAAENAHDYSKVKTVPDIIYEDENIILLDKKVGLLSHPDEGEYVDTLITRVERYLYEKGEYDPKGENSFAPALANRIDRNTGGIVIAAKNAESLRILNEKLKQRELHKLYLCVVIGTPKQKEGILKDYLQKNEKQKELACLYLLTDRFDCKAMADAMRDCEVGIGEIMRA